MKRRNSICLGISSLLSIIYEVYLIVLHTLVYQMPSISAEVLQKSGTFFTESLAIPHLVVFIIGSVFLLIAFFRNSFAISILAGILFLLSGVLYFPLFLFTIPSILLTFIGSVYCYKVKIAHLEEEEEKRYREQKPKETKVRKPQGDYASRQIQRRVQTEPSYQLQQQDPIVFQTSTQLPQQPIPQVYQTYVQPNVQSMYPQTPIYQQDPYASFYQPVQPSMYPSVPSPTMNMQQPAYTMDYPSVDNTSQFQQGFAKPEVPILDHQGVSEGYFDDSGNFKSGNSNF